ncbi:ankyrin repeat domain-containing protein [Sphingomonas sp. M1-B02]|uniref:ankyrin repeat domain-containing protein n=1 Tax=Sphingomonas sp. M1-B02 TaxID=3114300 RepID=UPI00223FEACD|nr:ankyrin repeat domain-containing protein [Sphingomonas sp. S6-11]UZK64869.1 ankyrin repeat domain-containing protein [Sphingomonas sp. S6-11]
MRRLAQSILLGLLVAGGVAGGGAVIASGASVQADPFDTARYLIKVKDSAGALTLIDSGQFDINLQTDEGYSLLHYAAEAGDLALVRAMLERGADPNLKNKLGMLPYQSAYSTLVKAELRKAMAAGKPAPAGQAAGQAAGLAAGLAAPGSSGMCEMARNAPASSSRSPALRPFLAARDAIWYNHPDELAGLIEDCVAVNSQDEYGWTLLHQAASRDRVALAKILLDRGASKTIRNKDGDTAGQLATSPEMKALLGGSTAATPKPTTARDTECQQKYRADAALCSDSTCKMGSMRKWQQCLKTGRYW